MAPAKTLYVRENDMPVWEQAEQVAQANSQSVSQVVTAALRHYLSNPIAATATDEIDILVAPHGAITFADSGGRPFLQYGRHPEHGHGWTLYYQEPNNGVDDHFMLGMPEQPPLREAREWLRLVRERGGLGEVTVEVGDPAITIGFIGRWLVEPDSDETRTGEAGHDAGAYWGVALTKRGRIAVYVVHCNERWPARLDDYDTLDAAAHDVPADIVARAAAAMGDERVIWRDI